MRIYVENVSTMLTDAEVVDALPAFRRQTYHVREWWRTSVEDIIFGKPPVEDAWQIVIADDSDQAGALGYHDFTPGGRPIAYVFAKTDQQYGASWTVTLSHELCEMIADPWISAAMQATNTRFYALELCDPVEDDSLGYTIKVPGHQPVLVSNFVTPNWFVPGSPKAYDYKGDCTKPLQVLSGGYAYYYENGQWQSIDNFQKVRSVEEFAKIEPSKTRLRLYARDRKEK